MNFEFLNFNKSSKELLVGIINKTCRKEFLPSQLIFDAPVAITGNKNTEVSLRSVGVGFFAGTTIRYNRLDLATMFQGVSIHIADGTYANTMDIVQDINQTFALMMGADDVVVETVNWSVDNKYILKAAPGSLVWTGQVEVVMDAPAVEPPPTKPLMESLYPATNIIDLNNINWEVTHNQWFIRIGEREHPYFGGDNAYGFTGGQGYIAPINTYIGDDGGQVAITEVFWPYWGEGSSGEVYISVSTNDPFDLPNEITIDGIKGYFQQWLPDEHYVVYSTDREVVDAAALDYVLLEFTGPLLTADEMNISD